MPQVFDDLKQILEESAEPARQLVNESILMTGGTGFVGTWLTHAWSHAATQLKGSGRLVIVSRDPSAFVNTYGPVPDRVSFIAGDVRSFDLKGHGKFDLVIHAATPARATINSGSPNEMLSIILDGQRHLLGQLESMNRPRVLFTSSGAIYGPQPSDVYRVDESQLTGPDPLNPLSAYHEGKRTAELMLAIATREGVVDAVIARLFAFVGPYLPLDEHFAVGNFLRDGLAGGPIVVKGDGTTIRSYQYPTDMVTWLWKIATDGAAGSAYNVGSDRGLTMREIAQACGAMTDVSDVRVLGVADPSRPVDRYVPCINKAVSELGLTNQVDFKEGLRRTVKYHRETARQS